MFKFLSLISFSVVSSFFACAQILDPEKNMFSEEPFFNSATIAANKIKSITTEHHFKRDKEKMHDKGIRVIYEFDESGKLIKYMNVFRKYEGERDTVFIFYEYDENGRWTVKRTTDNFGFYSLTFTYDSKGNIVEETFSREINAGGSNGNFVLAKQYPMGVEKYEFQYFSPAFYKKKYLNNLGTPFKEVSYMFNDKGKLAEETGTFMTTRMLERKTFEYDEKLKLNKKTEYTDVVRDVVNTFIYVYDANDVLLEIRHMKNEDFVKVTEFMLSDKGLVTAMLTRDNVAKMIEVVKFSYEFREQ
jgi:hypothetical protein